MQAVIYPTRFLGVTIYQSTTKLHMLLICNIQTTEHRNFDRNWCTGREDKCK